MIICLLIEKFGINDQFGAVYGACGLPIRTLFQIFYPSGRLVVRMCSWG